MQNLKKACEQINRNCGTILQYSSLYQTAAWGNTNQAPFINQVVSIDTALAPQELLDRLLAIETQMGRQRIEKWEPRILDLDILYFDQLSVRTETLIIPHPFIQERRFTLVPLVEIAADFVHPVLQKKQSELLATCSDSLQVEKLDENLDSF